jgi:hypothetical protein
MILNKIIDYFDIHLSVLKPKKTKKTGNG